jgi:hypothetical protein
MHIGICTDGELLMVGPLKGFVSRTKKINKHMILTPVSFISKH